jgi:hypothetical protein
MKPQHFLLTSSMAVVLFCLASCGGQSDNQSTTTDSTSNTESAPAVAAASTPSTIITTPQNMMVMKHKVANFNKWIASYDAHDSMRLGSGVHNYVIGRGFMDSNTILVATRIDDVDKAKGFAKAPGLKQAMQKAGVSGTPQTVFTSMVWQDTAKIDYDLRTRTSFTVKDWDVWQKSFDSGRQSRMDHGLIDRAYGHDADDNHKVTVVLALSDTAKAFAYWKSDELKQRQAASGVTTKPERFLYRVAKRY